MTHTLIVIKVIIGIEVMEHYNQSRLVLKKKLIVPKK